MRMLWLCVAALLCVAGSWGQEPDWGFQSYLDEDFHLTCNHTSLIVEPGNAIRWQLPSGEELTQNSSKFQLLDSASDNVQHMQLRIRNVQDSDAGVYICHVYEDMNIRTYRGRLLRGLNIGGPMYREPFDEYRYNLMVGGLAAVALFVPLVVMCFVYKFRYQTKEQKTSKYAQREEAFKHQRAFENERNGRNGPSSELSESGGGMYNVAYENEEKNTKL